LKRRENKADEPLILNISQLNNFIDKSTNELNGEFLHSQLLIDCLLRMKSNLTDKNELINLCRKIYENYPNELNIIKEFEENYLPNQALWWYTRESFLYRLLNKALRIQNIDLLYLFRFFIRDIENQLKKYQCSSSIRVYRGQLMSIDELNQLQNSLGEYISINSFFSTTLNRQKALEFLNNYSFSNDLYKILFEIDANSQLDHLKSFANITSISYYPNEQEILFMLGSIFRIINIKQDKNGLWTIQMILSNHNDENLKILFDNIKNEYSGINQETSLLSFGNLLHQMGKYDLAEKYFHRLLNDLPNDHQDISRCYHALGILALIKDNYDLSLQWHEKSLKILKSNDPRLADSYNCIGCIYQRKEDFKNALEFYNKTLIIWKNSFGEDYYQIADCLNNMGCVYETEKNYSKALECHQKALSIRKKNLPKDHRDLGGSYNNIGNIYLCLEQYDLALENYKCSYEIKIKSLPSQHSSLASTLQNIGLVYEQKQVFQQALIYYEKAAKIFRETFLSSHIHVIEIEQDIQRALSILNSQKTSTKF
jgi:tetratricopeptide (TPR) repeat protein